MLNKSSNWRTVSYADDLSDPNEMLSNEQESAKHNIFKILQEMQQVAAEPLTVDALASIVMSIDNGRDQQEAYAIAQEFIENPTHNEIHPEPAPEMENEVSQEQMMQTPEMDTLNSTVPPNAPPPGSTMAKSANEESLEEAGRQSLDDAYFESPYKEEGYSSEQELLDAIEEMIDQVVNTKEIPVENAVLLAAEEVLDVPVNSIEELDSHFPGLAEKVRDMISRANSTKEMQDARGLAENDPDEFVDRFAKTANDEAMIKALGEIAQKWAAQFETKLLEYNFDENQEFDTFPDRSGVTPRDGFIYLPIDNSGIGVEVYRVSENAIAQVASGDVLADDLVRKAIAVDGIIEFEKFEHNDELRADPHEEEDIYGIPGDSFDHFAKYPGHHKPGDKKHLKGEGPVNAKANEIYHAIMRDKDIKGEPSEEDKSSAAAIAWSQAKKNKKKAFFRGQEVEILDTYRDMWGENLSKIRVGGKIIDVPREAMEFKTEETLNDIEQLINFVEDLPREASTQSEMKARITNLKTAKDLARKILLNEDLSYGEQRALDSIHSRCAAELGEVEERLDNFTTEEDLQQIAELPTYEIGKEIHASAFTQHSADWLDGAAEDAASNVIEDVDKFVREDPILMITDLPEEMMSDAGAVRAHAKRRVASAAAYLNEDIRQEFITKYIENTENARRNALRISKIEKGQKVEKKKASFDSVPDEGLYF